VRHGHDARGCQTLSTGRALLRECTYRTVLETTRPSAMCMERLNQLVARSAVHIMIRDMVVPEGHDARQVGPGTMQA
jgi:hypothetical protein